jgi:hypothetical protein
VPPVSLFDRLRFRHLKSGNTPIFYGLNLGPDVLIGEVASLIGVVHPENIFSQEQAFQHRVSSPGQ